MAQYDLLPTFAKFLDPQLAFALLEFASARGVYDPKDVTAAQIQLLHGTNMVNYAIELYCELHGTEEPSAELLARRDAVLEKLPRLQEQAKPIIDIITKDENVAKLKADRASNNAYLQKEFGLGQEQIEALYNFGKMVFDSGDYVNARELLHQYSTYSIDSGRILSSIWGKLACEILLQDYGNAVDTLDRLREAIDAHLFADALKQLQQRTWLLHWANFVFWSTPDGPAKLLDLLLQDRFTVALQINAPHLLRYMVAAHLVSKGKQESRMDKWSSQLDQLRRIVTSEEYQFSDPVTDFVKAVYVDYDFDRAQERLKECEELLAQDYFLQNVKATFLEKARGAIFEVFCRIHQCVDLSALARQMGMPREEAESWIAQLIRTAQLDARIDSSANTMVMGTQYVDPLDAIIDRTNNLSSRTFKVANAIIDGMQPKAAPGAA